MTFYGRNLNILDTVCKPEFATDIRLSMIILLDVKNKCF